ncbi:hypothetical protein JCM6882_003678 [Rhodosporidiobolus microsporus]
MLLLSWIGQTIFPEVAPAAIWFTLIAMGICVGCDVADYKMSVNTVMLSILSTMLSFSISLRASSAVERWNAGRQAWTQVSLASRNLASLIWIHIGSTTLNPAEQAKIEPGSDEDEVENLKALIEKRTMLGLLQAFAAATKHYVRGESGIYYEDVYHLVKALPKYSFPSGIEDPSGLNREALTGLWRAPLPDGTTAIPVHSSSSARRDPLSASVGTASSSSYSASNIDLEKATTAGAEEVGVLGKDGKTKRIELLPAYNAPEKGITHYAPIFLLFRPILKLIRGDRKKRVKPLIATNIPLELLLFINGYVNTSIKRGTLIAPLVGVAFGYTNQLADALATMERVLSSPLPFAYGVHLRAVTYAFLVFLPFQTYALLGYLSILAEFVAAVVFLGFLQLGTDMEMPFGYDDSDLPLDTYCALIASELQEIAAHPAPSPSSYVWSPLNAPFQPFDRRSAPEILAEFSQSHGGVNQDGVKGVPGMRKFLCKHYNELEVRARKAREAAKRAHRRRGSENWAADGDEPVTVEVFTV